MRANATLENRTGMATSEKMTFVFPGRTVAACASLDLYAARYGGRSHIDAAPAVSGTSRANAPVHG